MEPVQMEKRDWGLVAATVISVAFGVATLIWPALGLTLIVAGFALFAVAACLYFLFELGVLSVVGSARSRRSRRERMRVTMAPEAEARTEAETRTPVEPR